MRMIYCCLACASFLSFFRVSVICTPIAIADARYSAGALARLSTDSAIGYLHGHGDYCQAGPTDTERIKPRVAGVRAMRRVGGRAARAHTYSRERMSSARGARREAGLSACSNDKWIGCWYPVHVGYQV